jgi:hypothetical protein
MNFARAMQLFHAAAHAMTPTQHARLAYVVKAHMGPDGNALAHALERVAETVAEVTPLVEEIAGQ